MVDRAERWVGDETRVPGPFALVGSSRGGFIMAAASRRLAEAGRTARAVFLIAPAIFKEREGYPHAFRAPVAERTVIFHGHADEVFPAETVWRFAARHGVEAHFLEDTHRMHASASFIARHMGDALAGMVGADYTPRLS